MGIFIYQVFLRPNAVYKSLNPIWTLKESKRPLTRVLMWTVPQKKIHGGTNHQELSNDIYIVDGRAYANTDVKCINLKNMQHYGNWKKDIETRMETKTRTWMRWDCFKGVGLTLYGFSCAWKNLLYHAFSKFFGSRRWLQWATPMGHE